MFIPVSIAPDKNVGPGVATPQAKNKTGMALKYSKKAC